MEVELKKKSCTVVVIITCLKFCLDPSCSLLFAILCFVCLKFHRPRSIPLLQFFLVPKWYFLSRRKKGRLATRTLRVCLAGNGDGLGIGPGLLQDFVWQPLCLSDCCCFFFRKCQQMLTTGDKSSQCPCHILGTLGAPWVKLYWKIHACRGVVMMLRCLQTVGWSAAVASAWTSWTVVIICIVSSITSPVTLLWFVVLNLGPLNDEDYQTMSFAPPSD